MSAAIDRTHTDELSRHCACYALEDDSGILRPHYCAEHEKFRWAMFIRHGYVMYERAFLTEAEARKRADVVKFLYRNDPRVEVVQVGRYWLVLASWGLIPVYDKWPEPSVASVIRELALLPARMRR